MRKVCPASFGCRNCTQICIPSPALQLAVRLLYRRWEKLITNYTEGCVFVGLTQQCHQAFQSCAKWRCIAGLVVPNISKERVIHHRPWNLEDATSEHRTTYSLIWLHIPEDQNLLTLRVLNSRYAYWLRLLGFVQLFTPTILQKLALFQFTLLSFQVKDTVKPWFQRFLHLMTEILKTKWSLITERTNSRTSVLHKGME